MISTKKNILLTSTDNNGRAISRPLMGDKAGIVRVSAYGYAPLLPIDASNTKAENDELLKTILDNLSSYTTSNTLSFDTRTTPVGPTLFQLSPPL